MMLLHFASPATAQVFPPHLDLSTLAGGDGTTGFVLNGADSDDLAGTSINVVDDVNGDGIGDLLIGAPYVTRDAATTAGAAYLLYGREGGFPGEFELSSLAAGNGSSGFVLHGESRPVGGQYEPVSNAGVRVSAGNLNGDGLDDLIIASSGISRTYVVFGRPGGFPAELELESLASGDGSTGFVFKGAPKLSANAGDISGDGVDDLVVSAGYEFANSYIVFGRTAGVGGFPAELDAFSIVDGDGSTGFELLAAQEFDNAGLAAGTGDINGDGIDDLLVSAQKGAPAHRDSAGETYAVFGREVSTGHFPPRVYSSSLGELHNGFGITLAGEAPGHVSGHSVAVGDVTGDGIDDMVIGAPGADPGERDNAGATYVVFGREGAAAFPPGDLELSSVASGNGSTGFVVNGIQPRDQTGDRVATGDVNGDGIGDLIIGAKSIGRETGRAYVVFGRAAGFPAKFELSSLEGGNGSTGFILEGLEPISDALSPIGGSGKSLAAGDINNDGVDDIVLGDGWASPAERDRAGRIYVVFGVGGTQ